MTDKGKVHQDSNHKAKNRISKQNIIDVGSFGREPSRQVFGERRSREKVIMFLSLVMQDCLTSALPQLFELKPNPILWKEHLDREDANPHASATTQVHCPSQTSNSCQRFLLKASEHPTAAFKRLWVQPDVRSAPQGGPSNPTSLLTRFEVNMPCFLVVEAAYGFEQSPSPALTQSELFPWCNCGSTVQVREKSVGPPSTAKVALQQISALSAAYGHPQKLSSVTFLFHVTVAQQKSRHCSTPAQKSMRCRVLKLVIGHLTETSASKLFNKLDG